MMPILRCECGDSVQTSNVDHATARTSHTVQLQAWHAMAQRVCAPTAVEPVPAAYRNAHVPAGPHNTRQDRVAFVTVLPTKVALVVVCQTVSSYVHGAAAANAGHAAAACDRVKITAYTTQLLNACAFVPISAEAYGRLGKPAAAFLGQLADLAAADTRQGLRRYRPSWPACSVASAPTFASTTLSASVDCSLRCRACQAATSCLRLVST